ncbi:hypothetical protein QR680_018245 [Steinernema hermaphroditum]|nr:hypothetical protein QR680_018245 [Steinernema hermaphroditum]
MDPGGTPSWVVEAVRPTNKISTVSMSSGGYSRKISAQPPAMSRKRSMRSRLAEIELGQAMEGRKHTPPIGAATIQLAPKKKSISSARIDLLSGWFC